MTQNHETFCSSPEELETQFDSRVFGSGPDPFAYVPERFAETEAMLTDVGTIFDWIKKAVNRRGRFEVPGLLTPGEDTIIRDLRVTKKGTRRELIAKTGVFVTRRVKLRFDGSGALLPTRAAKRLENYQQRYVESDDYPNWRARLVGRWTVFQGKRAAGAMAEALDRSDTKHVPAVVNLLKISGALPLGENVAPGEVVDAIAGLKTYVGQRLPNDGTFVADPTLARK